jgi:hypothetical protein
VVPQAPVVVQVVAEATLPADQAVPLEREPDQILATDDKKGMKENCGGFFELVAAA